MWLTKPPTGSRLLSLQDVTCTGYWLPVEHWEYKAISRKVVGKNVHATIPKGNMGYDQYTVRDDCSCRIYLSVLSFSTREHMSMASSAILSNFCEEKWTQPPTIPFGIVACTFSDNLFRNSCIHHHHYHHHHHHHHHHKSKAHSIVLFKSRQHLMRAWLIRIYRSKVWFPEFPTFRQKIPHPVFKFWRIPLPR